MTAPAPDLAPAPPPARSRHVSLTSFVVLIAAVALAATGQLMLKHGMTQSAAAARRGDHSLALAAATNLWVVGGLAVFAVSALAWLATLSRVPLNVAYPFNALGYLAMLVASVVVLHERANGWTVLGSVMVVGGLIMIVTLAPRA